MGDAERVQVGHQPARVGEAEPAVKLQSISRERPVAALVGRQAVQAFVDELKSAGMGLVLDIVPNHMGIGHGSNPWWQDVLENGRASAYADFFDIDWTPLKSELRDKVLLPTLGDQYGVELEAGHIQLHYEDGRFFCAYYDKRLPIDLQPRTPPGRRDPRRSRRRACARPGPSRRR